MWTYELTGKPGLDLNGIPQLNINYLKDGVRVFGRLHTFTSVVDLKKQVSTILDNLNLSENVITEFGDGSAFDLVIPPPTPEEVKQQEINLKLAELANAKNQLVLGIIDQPAYDAKLTDFKAVQASAAVVADEVIK